MFDLITEALATGHRVFVIDRHGNRGTVLTSSAGVALVDFKGGLPIRYPSARFDADLELAGFVRA